MKKVEKSGEAKAIPFPDNWHLLRTNVYNSRVYMCVGNRRKMCETIYDAFVAGDDPMEVSDAGDFAGRFCDRFGNERVGVNGECLSVCNDIGMQVWVVRMDEFAGSVDNTVVLSHECLHAALSILGTCGVSENPPFEALCYLHEAIFNNFMLFCFGRIGQLRYGPMKTEEAKK